MRRPIVTILLLLSSHSLFSQEMDKENLKIVTDFINDIRNSNKDNVCKSISFPFEREYPIPDINNSQEFLKRYNEIFDDSLTKMILNSDPVKDWGAVGYRGIMFNDGTLWLDYDGGLMTVNYQSKFEKDEYDRLVKIEKNSLHKSINKFDRPICILETSNYKIRIDDLGNGNYRYASWHLKSETSDKPDLVIQNGKLEFKGSGGNEDYIFKNAEYIYRCSIIVMGEDNSPPAELIILKGNETILTENAKIRRN